MSGAGTKADPESSQRRSGSLVVAIARHARLEKSKLGRLWAPGCRRSAEMAAARGELQAGADRADPPKGGRTTCEREYAG